MTEFYEKDFPLFPNSIWEHTCLGKSLAGPGIARAGTATELRRQARSQMEFGSEGTGGPPNAASPRRKPLLKKASHPEPAKLLPSAGAWRRRRTSNYSLVQRGPSRIIRDPCFDRLLMTPFLARSLSAQKAPALRCLRITDFYEKDFEEISNRMKATLREHCSMSMLRVNTFYEQNIQSRNPRLNPGNHTA
jgi:hypothetical protein